MLYLLYIQFLLQNFFRLFPYNFINFSYNFQLLCNLKAHINYPESHGIISYYILFLVLEKNK